MSAARTVRIDLRPLQKFERAIMEGLRGGATSGPVHKAFKQIAVAYRAWAKERFSRFSRGGGDWDALKPSTIARRRKGRGKSVRINRGGKSRTKTVASGTVSILYDTGTLIGGLDPTFNPGKGAMEKRIPFGVRVGFGGVSRHPKGKGASIADIANFHQRGNSKMAAREIIVEPPHSVAVKFAKLMENALASEWKRATA